MTYRTYGGTPDVVATDASGSVTAAPALKVYTTRTGSTQPPLKDTSGNLITTVSPISSGSDLGLVEFQADADGFDYLWLDRQDGSRRMRVQLRDVPQSQDLAVQQAITTTGSSTQSALDNRYPRKAGLPVDASFATGVDNTGAADSSAAIQAVLDANAQVADSGIQKVVRLQGVFNLGTAGIIIKGSLDASNAVFHYSGTGTAVRIGNSAAGQLQLINVSLGDIICDNKPAGASWVAGSVGLQVRNVFRSTIQYQRVINFETGLSLVGDASYGLAGVAYNTFLCGSLNNNKVNQSLQFSGVGGFVNQNLFLGGAWSHSDGTYPQAGMRHILIGTTGGGSLNNNQWVNCSLEGQREEYILDVYGNDNTWTNCRFEFVTNPPPVMWRAAAARNLIIGGYQSGALSQSFETGAVANSIISAQTIEFEGQGAGAMVLANSSGGTNGVLVIMRAAWRRLGDTLASGYMSHFRPGLIKLKNVSDTQDRIQIDGVNRFIQVGPGSAAPVRGIYWGAGSPEGVLAASPPSLYFDTSATSGGLYRKDTGTGNTGWLALT